MKQQSHFKIIGLLSLVILSIISLFLLSTPPTQTISTSSYSANQESIQTWDNTSDSEMNASQSVEFVYKATLGFNADSRKIPLISATESSRSFLDRDRYRGSVYVDSGHQVVFNDKALITLAVLNPAKPTNVEIHIKGTEVWAISNGHISYSNGAAPIRFSPDWISLYPVDNSEVKSSQVVIDVTKHDFFPNYKIGILIFSTLAISAFALIVFLLLSPKTKERKLNQPVKKMVITAAWVIGIFNVLAIVLWQLGIAPYQLVSETVRFTDFYQIDILSRAEPYLLANSNYPPFPIALSRLFSFLPSNLLFALVTVVSLGSIIGISLATLKTNNRLTGYIAPLIISLNFPVLFGLDRGNLELPTIALLMWVLVLSLNRKPKFATVILGIATALKLFPLIIFGPLISAKRYRYQLVAAAGIAIFLTLAGGFLFGLDALEIAKRLLFTGSVGEMAIGQKESWGFSLNSGILLVSDVLLGDMEKLQSINEFLGSRKWLLVTGGLWLVSLVWATFFEKELWRKIAISSAAILVFAGTTFQYRGSILLIPVLLIALTKARVFAPKFLGFLIGLALAPVGLLAAGHSETSTISTAILPCVILSLLIYLILTRREFLPLLEKFVAKVSRLRLNIKSIFSAFVGLFLITSSVLMTNSYKNSEMSWHATPADSTSVLGKAVAGFRGANTRINVPAMEGQTTDRNLTVLFLGVGGQVNCPTVIMTIQNKELVISVPPQGANYPGQEITFSLSNPKESINITFLGDGKTFSVDSAENQTLSFSNPICFDVAFPQIVGNDAEAGIDIAWWRTSILPKLVRILGFGFVLLSALFIFIPRFATLNKVNNK